MKVFITGDSHTGAMKRALSSDQKYSDVASDIFFEIRPLGGAPNMRVDFFLKRNSVIVITDEIYSRHVKTIPPEDSDFDVYGVCAGFNPRPLLRYRSWAQVASGKRGFASSALVHQSILDDMAPVIRFFSSLKSIGLTVFAIESPAPFRSDPQVRRLGEQFVLDFYRRYREVAHVELAKVGVSVVRVPDSCVDNSGFMHDIYSAERAGDNNHANAVYGGMMLERISTTLKPRHSQTFG